MGRVTFIIADDYQPYRHILRTLIERQPGWSVIAEASNGAAAEMLALSLNPDVVLLDLGMPLMNGIEVTRSIRQRKPQIHVFLFSGYNDEEFRHEGLGVGANACFFKEELTIHRLVQAVEGLCIEHPNL